MDPDATTGQLLAYTSTEPDSKSPQDPEQVQILLFTLQRVQKYSLQIRLGNWTWLEAY